MHVNGLENILGFLFGWGSEGRWVVDCRAVRERRGLFASLFVCRGEDADLEFNIARFCKVSDAVSYLGPCP